MAERLTVAEDVEGSSPFSHPIHTNTLIVTILIGQNNQGIVSYPNFIENNRSEALLNMHYD